MWSKKKRNLDKEEIYKVIFDITIVYVQFIV